MVQPRNQTRHAIILAGGRGTRLARMTCRMMGAPVPKQFCSFTPDGPTLLQATAARARRMVDGQVSVVVGREHALVAEHQLLECDGSQVLTQPCDRGTGMGLLLPLVRLAVRDSGKPILVLPADHGFSDERVLEQTVKMAFASVDQHVRRIVLLAAEASRPATDYGWIVPGRSIDDRLVEVRHLVEKPTPDGAARLLDARSAWSTMMMVGTAGALLELFWRQARDTVRVLAHHATLPVAEQSQFLEDAYQTLPSLDLSRHVLAPDGQLCMMHLPRSAGWSDLGTEQRMRSWIQSQTEVA